MEAYSTPSVPTSHSSLPDYFQQLPLSAQWALRHLEFEGNFQLLRRSLSLGTALAVSDGSFISPFSTASWTITNQSDSMSGLCCVPALDKYQDAYRGELGGLYGITLVIWALEQYYPADQYSLDIYCDGQEA